MDSIKHSGKSELRNIPTVGQDFSLESQIGEIDLHERNYFPASLKSIIKCVFPSEHRAGGRNLHCFSPLVVLRAEINLDEVVSALVHSVQFSSLLTI